MTAKIGSSRVVVRVTGWLLGVTLAAVDALAQTAHDLVGTWTIATSRLSRMGPSLSRMVPIQKAF